MRITESQLRRIVRRIIREAPLADFYPTVDAPTGAVSPYSQPSDPGNIERLKRTFEHPNFSGRLRKLLQSFPVDVSVMPIALDEAGLFRGERLVIYDKSTFAQDIKKIGGDPLKKGEATALMLQWAATAPAQSCLICPISYSAGNKIQGITPWMIFHSFFDSDGGGGTDWRIFRACPSIQRFQEKINDVSRVLWETDVFHPEANSTSQKVESMKLIEKIFTFGSARQGYLSRHQGGEWADIENEASVQACLTTKGFTYSSDAVSELPIDEELRDEIEGHLAEAAALSPACKSEFADFLRGKIIVVSGLPE